MSSILYLGGSIREAIKVFNEAEVGLDSWGQPNASYGVVLSVWDEGRRDYVIKCRKGIDE
jgi:hypothetical protein